MTVWKRWIGSERIEVMPLERALLKPRNHPGASKTERARELRIILDARKGLDPSKVSEGEGRKRRRVRDR